jgi:uncharacterized protein YdeI (YjbR/CyaY-like superfamily)
MRKRLFKNRTDWRRWLEENHASADEIWLVFYKKHTGRRSLQYEEAVEEALCFGWIDSKLRRIDDEKHMQRYTPRRAGSNWAKSNRDRIGKLTAIGRMTEAGFTKVAAAKRDGSWDRLHDVEDALFVPEDLRAALEKVKDARKNFNAFAPSHRKQYLWWLESAKRSETRQDRIQEIVKRAAKNIKPGK